MEYYNYHCLIDSNFDDSDENTYWYIGRYGERLHYTDLKDGTFIFTCSEIELDDLILPPISMVRIVQAYTLLNKNPVYFNVHNKHRTTDWRIDHLSNTAWCLWKEYQETKDEECMYLLKQIVYDMGIFKLSRNHFWNWFCDLYTFQSEDFKKDMMKLRAWVRRKMEFSWKVSIKDSVLCIHIYGHSLRKAKKNLKNKNIRNINFEGIKMPYWKASYSINGEIHHLCIHGYTKNIVSNLVQFNNKDKDVKIIKINEIRKQ